MGNHDDTPLSFCLNTEMWWYSIGDGARISIGAIESMDRELPAEIVIEWITISSGRSPRLKVFDDAWGWFSHPLIQQLFAWMATVNDQNVPPVVFCAKLIELGFVCENKPRKEG